jgi:hypothetical protein
LFNIIRSFKVYSNETDNINGFLSIEAVDTNNRPVANAIASLFRVTVKGQYFERGEGIQIARYITDDNGRVPLITLPSISSSEVVPSQQRTRYYMTLNAYGYYEVVVTEIQIYPGITTSYRIVVSPITAPIPRYEFIYNPIIRENQI